MTSDVYQFRLGTFEGVSISDGGHRYRLENFFANVPQDQLEPVLRQHGLPTDHITTPYTCLYFNTGEHRVMVDVGAGDMTPHTGKLLRNMKAAGLSPADIDTIIITHAHPDHVGGMLDNEGQPIYRHAQYYCWKDEWDFWRSDAAAAQAPERHVTLARKKLEPIQDRLSLLEREDEIVPGIRAVAAPGHTPGHMALSISSNGEQLLHVSDVVLYPLHLEHPTWVPVYDIIPEQAAITKHTIFDRAAEQHALVFAHHFPPFPNLGHVVKRGEGWQWQPIATG